MKLIVADALASMDMDMRERCANAFVMGLREILYKFVLWRWL